VGTRPALCRSPGESLQRASRADRPDADQQQGNDLQGALASGDPVLLVAATSPETIGALKTAEELFRLRADGKK